MGINLKKILGDILGIFKSAASKAWDKLDEQSKNEAITATSLSQIIKTSIGGAYEDFLKKATDSTGLPTDQVEAHLIGIAKDLGSVLSTAEEAYKFIHDQATSKVTDNGWNSFWHDVMKFAAVSISQGHLDWITLSLGVAEIAYQKLFKK